jgi:hypothetical protein
VRYLAGKQFQASHHHRKEWSGMMTLLALGLLLV